MLCLILDGNAIPWGLTDDELTDILIALLQVFLTHIDHMTTAIAFEDETVLELAATVYLPEVVLGIEIIGIACGTWLS